MYVENMRKFVEEATYPSDYKHDFGVILTEYELEELHRALDEYVANNNIIKVTTVAQINEQIRIYLEKSRNDEGGR